MKNVMTRAWEIAKEAVENFGGEAFEYISGALKQAWSETKDSVELQGSEKQIAWAEDIRNAYVEKVAEYMELKEKEEKVTSEVTVMEIRLRLQSLRSKINRSYNTKRQAVRKSFEGTKEERRIVLKEIKSAYDSKIEKAIERKINAMLSQTSAGLWIELHKGLV